MAFIESFLLIMGGAVLIALLVRATVIIRPHEKGVVERMGRYSRTLGSGMNFITPFVERCTRVDMRETIIDVPAQEVITQDNVAVSVDAVIYFQIIDPFKVIYNVAKFDAAAITLAQTNLRNLMGEMTLDGTFASREKINVQLRQILDDATDRWGVRVTRVEIQRIDPPKDIVDSMSRQMKAERTKRAAILEAEGARKSAILKAEGDAQAMMTLAEAERKKKQLVAQGEAEAISNVYSAIHEGKPDKGLLTIKYLEALEKMAEGKATKIFMPLESSGVLSGVAALGDILKEKENNKDTKKEVKDKK